MEKFQNSSGVACCLDWNRKIPDKCFIKNPFSSGPLYNSQYKVSYCKDVKKDSCIDLYDNAINNYHARSFQRSKSHADLQPKKPASSICLIKRDSKSRLCNQSSSQDTENSLNYYINKKPSCYNQDFHSYREPHRPRSPNSRWSGKFASDPVTYGRKNSLQRPSRRDVELVPAMKDRDYHGSRGNYTRVTSSESRCDKPTLKTINSFTLIKQKYKKREDFYDFYKDCTSENDVCSNLLKYYQERCGKKGHKNVCKDRKQYPQRTTQYQSKSGGDNDDYIEKEVRKSVDCDYQDASERRTYKDPKLAEMVESYKNRKYEGNNEGRRRSSISENAQQSQACNCKNICDIICHKCQRKLINKINENKCGR